MAFTCFIGAAASESVQAATLTVSGLSAAGKIYDGTPTTMVDFSGAVLNGVAPEDVGNVSLATNGYTASFSDKNVGDGKTVTVGGLSLSGGAAGNYTLTPPVLSANITARPFGISATGTTKTYNATTNATVTLGLLNKISGDDVAAFYGTASFTDKNVGVGKPVLVDDLFITGTDASNYNLTNTTASTTATISAKTLRVAATGQNKPYDGTTAATATLSDNHLGGDAVTDTYASATFENQYVGDGLNIAVSGIAISGPDAGNYHLNSTTASAQANIEPRTLTVTAAGVNKVYDGGTNATVTLGNNRLTNDVITVSFSSASFSGKNAGTNVLVTVFGLVITGPDSDSYTLTNTTVFTTANIATRGLNVVAAGVNKIYDGTTNATVTLGDNRLSGDNLTDNYAGAGFTDKNVGNGKIVTVTGVSVGGPDAANYSPASTTATTPGNIAACSLTVTATGVNKVYDGTTNATVSLGDNRVAGDSLTDTYTSAGFSDKNVGNGKTVKVTGIQVTGGDSGNYILSNSTASTTANISGRTLTVAATGQDKIYDGGTTAAVTLSDNQLAGDTIAVSYASANFADKLAGNGKAINIAGISLGGTSVGNYTLAGTNATATANITARPLAVTATGINKVYDGTVNATVTLADNRVGGDSFVTSYGSAIFASSLVGNNRSVNVTGIFITGTDAGNYALSNTTASTSANITTETATATLASSRNPSGFRDAITFSESLPVDATGTVTYFTNGAVFASGALSGGNCTSGSISNLLRGTNSITAIYSGDGNYSGATNILSQVVTNHPPITGFFSFSVTNGVSLKVKISDLLTAVVDPDGDPITLTSVSVSTNGMVSPTNATYILFRNTNYVNDRFSYTVTDGFGGYATGQVFVFSVLAPFTGQNTTLNPIGGTNTVTNHGIPGYVYIIQRSINLLTWTAIATNTAAGNGLILTTDRFTDLGAPPASAFYRLEWKP